MKKKKSEHYVDNKKFLAEMVLFKEKCDKAKAKGKPNPPITNYMGECFLKIANHLSYRPNFINYTYKDDMISDGIENCLQYVANFNPDKFKYSANKPLEEIPYKSPWDKPSEFPKHVGFNDL